MSLCCFANFLIVFSVVISVLFLAEDGFGMCVQLNWFRLVMFCEAFDSVGSNCMD